MDAVLPVGVVMPRESILVIDDEYGIRSGIRQILELEGYAVVEAECGQTALQVLEQQRFAVALIDYRLPDLDGLTLLQAIRSRQPATKTCMITAYANLETAIAATRQGIDFFLPKPFSPDDLLGVVEMLLRHRQLEAEAEELRQAHEASLAALATEQSQTHCLVSCLRDAVLVINRQGLVVLANPALVRLIGQEEADLLGQPAEQLLADRPGFQPLAELLRAGVTERSGFELQLREQTLVVSLAPFRDAAGQVLGRIVTLADITAVRRLALEKARFIRTMVHEFKSPLGAVKGLLEVGLDRSLGNALEPYLPLLERAEQRLDGLVQLIHDLLALSQLEALPEATVGQRPVEVAAIVAEVAAQHRERASSRQIEVQTMMPPELPPARVAEEELQTILTNLVSNAVKYNRPGGRVTISAVPQPGWVRVEVADTGLGLQPESVARVGEEFFREKRKETREIEGNGLGLAIVRRLVERNQGRLEVTSTLGVGSTFSVWLPR